MQDEAAVGLYRAAAEDVHRLAACRRQLVRAQLFEYVAEAEPARAIDHQTHGALFVVLHQIGDGLGKVGVRHMRHGDQEVVLEVGRGAVHGR
ncbi:hypothetical protein D9M72_608100 [compost metagenome]